MHFMPYLSYISSTPIAPCMLIKHVLWSAKASDSTSRESINIFYLRVMFIVNEISKEKRFLFSFSLRVVTVNSSAFITFVIIHKSTIRLFLFSVLNVRYSPDDLSHLF
jgi:hypothetical protein